MTLLNPDPRDVPLHMTLGPTPELPAPNQDWGLTPAQAIDRMRIKHELYESTTGELKGVDPDEAFTLGYATALHDYTRFTGPNPAEFGLMTLQGERIPATKPITDTIKGDDDQ